LILDLFHGSPLRSDQHRNSIVIFRYTITYICAILFGIYWVVSITYSRFLLGAHSLD
jgi:hypothetical protein